MLQSLLDVFIQFSLAGVSFIAGALVSAILLIPLEENLLEFLRKRWWLFRKKAVRGTIVKGYFVDKARKDKAYQLNPSRFIMQGKPDGPFRMYFELKLPYPNIKEDAMPIAQSDDLIRQAYYHQNKIYVDDTYWYPVNGVSMRSDVIIRNEDLDVKPPK